MAGALEPRILIFPGGSAGVVLAIATARGCAAIPARDVEAGLDLLATQPLDVAVLGVDGPLGEVLALCRRLRAAPGGDRVAVVAVCPSGCGDATAALLEAGATVVAAANEQSIGIQLDAAVWWVRRSSAQAAGRAPAERALLERAARSFRAASAEVIGLFVWDATGSILDANDAFLQMSGYSREEIEAGRLSWVAITPPEHRAADERALSEVLKSGICAPFEKEFLHRDGRRVPILIAPALVEGARDRGVCFVFDRTAQRAAEGALRASEERMRLVVRATSDAFWDWDLSSGRVTGSERMRSFYGTGGGDIEEDAVWWFERVHPDDRDRVMNGLRRAIEGGGSTFELWYRCLLADGSYADVHDRGIVLRDAAGKAYRMLGAVADVTERRQMEARLQLADRMASLGTLAAGVAHEINNPLAYMVANLDFARKELRSKGPAARVDAILSALDEASEGGACVRHIVGSLKTFSRADDGALGPVEVDRVIQLVLRMAQPQIRSKARLVTELGRVPPVHANEAQLGQVILNLLVNAAQALPEGKEAENEIRIATALEAPGRVRIEVHDTGPGIAPELRSRIFDPFFTTKPIGEGTGLGLAICHGIVTSFRGEIRVESEVGKGACFRVLLPAFHAVARAAARDVDARAAARDVDARAAARDVDARAAARDVDAGEALDECPEDAAQ
ncbi:histidine kinase [Sorangium cellulosum]|uniref:histidine kinase n=1 Tax=Sorangium cellulosum TaxID=56 RepID=A0A2L0ELP6_SORCE|nr:PAS domain-containing protein [Sorangium cellulosum]AUX40217.1 histidine kinase [Sorangium cellulosum]